MKDIVITGVGLVSPFGVGKEKFWDSLEKGADAVSEISSFCTDKFKVHRAGEIKDFAPKEILGKKGLRNLNRTTLLLLAAAHLAIEDSSLEINDDNTDVFGVVTATSFAHLDSIISFDREVIKDGLKFSNPALFPSTVINAPSSYVSIRNNIQGFNATVSTGYSAGLDAVKYALDALETEKARTVLCCGAEALTPVLFFGFHQLKYLAGIKGPALSCPYDQRRNGPLLGEGAAVFCLEEADRARERGRKIYARVKSAASFYDGYHAGKVNFSGEGLAKSIIQALDKAGVSLEQIDYISAGANSSSDLDKVEVKVLKDLFGKKLKKIPVSSVKSMIGETISAAGSFQIASCIGAMQRGLVPPTINYEKKDPECAIDCVPNKAQKKKVDLCLITSFGPGGYNSACVLEKYKN